MLSETSVLDRFCLEVGQSDIIRNSVVERQLIKLYQENGSEVARDILVKSCLRFVVKQAHRYAKGNLDRLAELVAAGNIGLLVALEKYDLRRRTRLLTYATSWIHLHMHQELQRDSTVAIPVWHQHAKRQLTRAQQEVRTKTGKRLNVRRLCRKTGYSKIQVERLLSESGAITSVDAVAPSGATLLDVLPLECHSVDEQVHLKERDQLVRSIVDKLPEQEKNVLILYFGLDGRDPMTSQQIGDQMGVCRERARQIQQRARSMFAKKLRSYLTYRERDMPDHQLCTAVL